MSRKKKCKDVMIKILNKYNVSVEKKINDSEKKMYINKFPIYIINLREDIIRRNYIHVIMEKMNINYQLVIVERIQEEDYQSIKNYSLKNITKGMFGCYLSHLWCLKHIIQNKYKGGAIIFEDDIVVHKNFENMFDRLFKEKQFDFLSMGACDFDFFGINHKNVVDNLYQPSLNSSKRCYGAHANYYSLNGAKYIFKLKSLFFSFFDNNFSKIFKHFNTSAFITYPNLFVTELSTSNINHNYHFFSSYENYFYSNCFTDFKFQEYRFLYLCMIQKMFDYYEKNKITTKINETSIVKLLYNTLDDISIEEKVSLIRRIDLDFFTCKDIQTIMGVGETDE
jgi:GR25 family glycosyltransferase involved in LPS biosynthesis